MRPVYGVVQIAVIRLAHNQSFGQQAGAHSIIAYSQAVLARLTRGGTRNISEVIQHAGPGNGSVLRHCQLNTAPVINRPTGLRHSA